MKIKIMLRSTSLLLLLSIALVFSCKTNKETVVEQDNHLGVLEHNFTINEAAKSDFEKGLLLIHSFEYDDALTSFQAAKEKDSTEIMSYWGEAMSHYKALWGLQDKRAGYAVLEQIGLTKEERYEKISDPLEKDFWEGVEILYGDGSLKDRNEQFNDHMGMLHEKYPKNQEAAAFYALSMMWKNNKDEDTEVIGQRSAKIAAGILEENPLHPGALHYTIHAYDNPELAELAMDAAGNYSKVAPDAGHALHMPSHIYLAMGMWPEVVASNEVSYQASVNRMNRLELDDEARGYHAYAWLHYAYLQQGREEDAIKLLSDIAGFYENTQSKGIRGYIAMMQAAQLFDTGNWPEELEVLEVNTSDLGLGATKDIALFQGKMALENKSLEQFDKIIPDYKAEIKKAELYVSEENTKMCSSGPTRYAPNPDAIKKAKAVLFELYAMQAMINDYDGIDAFLREAVAFEEDSEYSFGPADILYPTFEMYGDWLLTEKRYDDALVQFNKSLERAPNRRKALLGKKSAAQALGKAEIVNEVERILEGFNPTGSLSSL